MSQTTANDLISALGMKQVSVDHPPATAETPRKRNLIVVLASVAVLAAGFKVLGDYVCDQAIDTWASKQRAVLSVPDPETQALFAKWEQESAQDSLAESTTESLPTP